MSMPERLDQAVACQRSERRSKTIRQIDLLALIETRPIEIESDETAWCGLHLQKGLTDPETFDTSTSVVLTAAVHLLPEPYFAAFRLLVLDSPRFLENVCCRTAVARQ